MDHKSLSAWKIEREEGIAGWNKHRKRLHRIFGNGATKTISY
jgi:hypothetical protein